MSYDRNFIKSCSREKLLITDLGTSDSFFDSIEKLYPTSGGRLNLSLLHDYKYAKANPENTTLDYYQFVESLQGVIDGTNEVIYLGDNLTENAYLSPGTNLLKLLPCIAEIPQSHYLLAKDLSWCISLSFENDMEFGRINTQ